MKLYNSSLLGATMDLTQKRIYFFGGVFSQWTKSNISWTNSNNLTYIFSCAEQAMMYRKALAFDDIAVAKMIFLTKDPQKQKALGRTIKNYSDDVWDKVKYDIIVENNYLKFHQNPSLGELLIHTSEYELVEASPYDKIYGIGLGMDDPNITDKTKWSGENLLGKAIMEARSKIIDEL